jgi:transposase
VNKRFRVCDLDQPFLLPPSLQDWLPENHLARFVAEVMNELDLSAIYAEFERSDGRGLSADPPLLLTRLLLYGYSIGVTSSRAIEKATYDRVAFRYLAADQHPEHDTIASFRQQHLEALANLFLQALRLCHAAGLVKLGNVALDGTKMLANASTHRSVTHQQLSEREQRWKAVIARLLTEAEQTDRREDQQFGRGQKNDPLPAELAYAQSRLARMQQAKAELEKEAQQKLDSLHESQIWRKPGRPRKDEQSNYPPRDPQQRDKEKKRRRRARRSAAAPTRQYNFVDPDSRVMRDNARKCFMQGYNAQIAVDTHQQVIVAAEVRQQVTDREQLLPMVESIRANSPTLPQTVLAHAGYWDTASLRDLSRLGIRVLVSPDAEVQDSSIPLPPTVPKNEEATRMRQLLLSPAGRALYRLRQATVEPVFGYIKEARGLRRFRFRGLSRVQCEWKLICATHNLLKLFHHRTALVTD